jgi:hypothetical protein
VKVTPGYLRDTQMTRFAIAGSTEAESAAIAGHSLHDVNRILGRDTQSRTG